MHHILNIMNYFASLRPGRRDDPLTAEWKGKQLRAWANLLILLIGLGLSAAIASFLDTMDGNPGLSTMSERWRPAVSCMVAGGLGLVLLFTVCSWAVGRSLLEEAGD
ncbi:hypothetical protein [Variovorax sp. PBL-H6]|nr:hypothetical protein [Variovorax sp. PBL-H6]